mgnify:CR=1 FL=1
MILSSFLLSGLDYQADKREKLKNRNFLIPSFSAEVLVSESEFEIDENIAEYSNCFLFDYIGISSIYKSVISKLKNEYEKNSISSNVYKTSYDLINLLPESVLYKLNLDNVYASKYGTLILDWEDNDSSDEFSLEIGNDCFGYFSEFKGKDSVNVEEVKYSIENVDSLHKDMEDFFNR